MIHASLALWYTRRQRRSFEAGVDSKLAAARAGIVAEVTSRIPPAPDLVPLETRLREAVIREVAGFPAKLELEAGKITVLVQTRVDQILAEIPSPAELQNLEDRVVSRSTSAIQGWWGARVKEQRDEAVKRGIDPETAQDLAELSEVMGKQRAGQVIGGLKVLERLRDRRARRGRTAETPPDGSRSPAPASGERAPAGNQDLQPHVVAALERAGFKREQRPALTDGRGASEDRAAAVPP